jgi:hypothetical protein
MDEIIHFESETLHEDLIPYIVKMEKIVMIKNPLVNTFYYKESPLIHSELNGRINLIYSKNLEYYNECLEANNIEELAWLIERPFRITWFEDYVKEHISSISVEKFYELLGELIIDSENTFQIKDSVMNLINLMGNPRLMMNQQEKDALNDLPEFVKIYRGVSSSDTFYDHLLSYSWTTDYDKAVWFSKRFKSDKEEFLVFEMEISKDEIISFFTRRSESEVILDYTKIDIDNLKINYLENPNHE